MRPLVLASLTLLSIAPAATAAQPDKDKPAKQTPPGQAKDKETPPGLAKKDGVPPGLVTNDGVPPGQEQRDAAGMLVDPGPAADPTLTQVGTTAGAAPAGGTIKVRVPGSDAWTALPDDAPLPMGSRVDATDGLVEIASEAVDGTEQNVVVTGAVFRISQDVATGGITDLRLKGGDFDDCAAAPAPAAGKARAAAARKGSGDKVVRGLWAAGKGKFRTRGRYASAAVRGTRWATVDRCSGTTIKVFDGIVDVTDLITGSSVAVRAGEKRVLRAPDGR